MEEFFIEKLKSMYTIGTNGNIMTEKQWEDFINFFLFDKFGTGEIPSEYFDKINNDFTLNQELQNFFRHQLQLVEEAVEGEPAYEPRQILFFQAAFQNGYFKRLMQRNRRLQSKINIVTQKFNLFKQKKRQQIRQQEAEKRQAIIRQKKIQQNCLNRLRQKNNNISRISKVNDSISSKIEIKNLANNIVKHPPVINNFVEISSSSDYYEMSSNNEESSKEDQIYLLQQQARRFKQQNEQLVRSNNFYRNTLIQKSNQVFYQNKKIVNQTKQIVNQNRKIINQEKQIFNQNRKIFNQEYTIFNQNRKITNQNKKIKQQNQATKKLVNTVKTSQKLMQESEQLNNHLCNIINNQQVRELQYQNLVNYYKNEQEQAQNNLKLATNQLHNLRVNMENNQRRKQAQIQNNNQRRVGRIVRANNRRESQNLNPAPEIELFANNPNEVSIPSSSDNSIQVLNNLNNDFDAYLFNRDNNHNRNYF